MFKKIKRFWTNHKSNILIATGTVVGLLTAKAIYDHLTGQREIAGERSSEDFVKWYNDGDGMSLEEAQAFLEVNNIDETKFGMFKESTADAFKVVDFSAGRDGALPVKFEIVEQTKDKFGWTESDYAQAAEHYGKTVEEAKQATVEMNGQLWD